MESINEVSFKSIDEAREALPNEKWFKAGKPRMFVEVENDGEYIAYVDIAYDGMKLLKIATGEEWTTYGTIILTPMRVMLDKEFHELPKYIWR